MRLCGGEMFLTSQLLYFVKPIEGFGVAEVVDSDDSNFKPGDIISGITRWEDYSLINKGSIQLRKVEPDDLPLSFHVGLLGMFSTSVYKSVLNIGNKQFSFFLCNHVLKSYMKGNRCEMDYQDESNKHMFFAFISHL